jgi:cytochrome b6-f complex iron-sulfur subunit
MESEARSAHEEETQEQPGAATRGDQPVPKRAIDTPVAKPVSARPILTRRVFILGGFWSTLSLALVGILGPSLDFVWTRDPAGAARKVRVSKETVQAAIENGEPVPVPEGKFFLVNLEPGVTPNGEETDGGLLALWQKCPHLGCAVPWRPDFTFRGRTGWFRCPCHGSTYTKEGGVLVFGPAPRPMDRFEIEPQDDGSVVVNTGVTVAIKGSPENPSGTISYEA